MSHIWELYECVIIPYVLPRNYWDGKTPLTITEKTPYSDYRQRDLIDRYHTEEEVYDRVLDEIAEFGVREDRVSFEAHAFDAETLKYIDFTWRTWDHQGKPLDGHKSPYYLEWQPNDGSGDEWTRRIKEGLESHAEAYCLLLNGLPYDTPYDSGFDYRVVDRDGIVLGYERPKATGDLEKENYTYKEEHGVPY